MRSVLIDWIVEVSEEFRMQSETVFLCVAYIDRYLSRMEASLPRTQFQLLGVSSLLIAAKLEEHTTPVVADLVILCDNTYSREEIIAMEANQLNVLGFDLTIFTARHFVQHLLNFVSVLEALDDNLKELMNNIANYLCELSLLDYKISQFRPSLVASAAICLARTNIGLVSWSESLQRETFFSIRDLLPCCQYLLNLYRSAQSVDFKHQAPYLKYSKIQYRQAALRQFHDICQF